MVAILQHEIYKHFILLLQDEVSNGYSNGIIVTCILTSSQFIWQNSMTLNVVWVVFASYP